MKLDIKKYVGVKIADGIVYNELHLIQAIKDYIKASPEKWDDTAFGLVEGVLTDFEIEWGKAKEEAKDA